MMKCFSKLALALFLMVVLSPSQIQAGPGGDSGPELGKPAIVLAIFGTSEPAALKAIENVDKRIRAAFPDYDVYQAYTSNIIRDKWHGRATDEEFKKANPGLDKLYSVQHPLTVLANIYEDGPRPIMVQSLHIVNGSEFGFVENIVTNLSEIEAMQAAKKPFPYLVLGESALGKGTEADLNRAAKALEPLAKAAKEADASLLLFGHGNGHLDIKSYHDFPAAMTKMYGQKAYLGLVEGEPTFEQVLAELKKDKVKKIYLAPFMLVAGDHTINDMVGPEEDSWINMLKKEGFEVVPYAVGLGEIDSWADIYVERLKVLEKDMKEKLAEMEKKH